MKLYVSLLTTIALEKSSNCSLVSGTIASIPKPPIDFTPKNSEFRAKASCSANFCLLI